MKNKNKNRSFATHTPDLTATFPLEEKIVREKRRKKMIVRKDSPWVMMKELKYFQEIPSTKRTTKLIVGCFSPQTSETTDHNMRAVRGGSIQTRPSFTAFSSTRLSNKWFTRSLVTPNEVTHALSLTHHPLTRCFFSDPPHLLRFFNKSFQPIHTYP